MKRGVVGVSMKWRGLDFCVVHLSAYLSTQALIFQDAPPNGGRLPALPS